MKNISQPERVQFLGCPVDRVTIDQTLEWIAAAVKERIPRQVLVVNANKFYLMAREAGLRDIVLQADLVIAEWAVVWGARQLGLPSLAHVGGIMLAQAFMPYAAKRGLRSFFLGAKAEIVHTLVQRLQMSHPNLEIAGYHHGYLATPEIEREAEATIRQARPDVLFVGMGSPRQEFWIHAHRATLGVPVSIGVGGSFDVMAGLKADAPTWVRGKGFEWVYRIAQEPRAYWKRYLLTNTWFVWRVMTARLMRA